jgi:hypothetical protein
MRSLGGTNRPIQLSLIPASRKRRRKGNPVVSDETNVGLQILCDSDH